MVEIDTKALRKLIENGGVPYKERHRSFVFTCPRCQKKEKLWLRKSDGRFVCFYCAEIDGYKGRPEYALRDLLGLSLDEIRAKLYGLAVPLDADEGLVLDFADFYDDGDDDTLTVAAPLPEVAWPTDTFEILDPRAARGLAYVEGRGIPAAVAAEYGLRYWAVKRRVIFPVAVDGRLLGYQARATYPTEWTDVETGETRTAPKILTSEGLARDRVVMFQDRLRGAPHAVVCEGPVDALKAHLCGGNVATMGKAVSAGQLQVIRDAGIERVYLALDPDAAEETTRLARELGDLDVRLIEVPHGRKDLGECTMEEVYEAFVHARSFTSGHLLLGGFDVPAWLRGGA